MGQIGIGEEEFAECDRVRFACGERFLRAFRREALVGDVDAAERLLELRAQPRLFHGLANADEGDFSLAEFVRNVAKRRREVAVAHVMEIGAWREMHADPAPTPGPRRRSFPRHIVPSLIASRSSDEPSPRLPLRKPACRLEGPACRPSRAARRGPAQGRRSGSRARSPGSIPTTARRAAANRPSPTTNDPRPLEA